MIRKFIKNIFSEFKNQKGFTLLEVTMSLMISTMLIGGVIVIFQNNFNVIYQSINDSEKRNTMIFLDNKIKDALKYSSEVEVVDGNNTLKVDNIEFRFVEQENLIVVTIDGNEDMKFYEIKKYLSNPVFQINDNRLEVNYQITNRNGEKNISKKYILYKLRYDEEYLNK